MNIYWNSFAEFLAMGRHGVYVWGSVGVMAVLMVLEPILIIRGQKGLVARLKRQFRAESTEVKIHPRKAEH
jgi:heme exporter protein D